MPSMLIKSTWRMPFPPSSEAGTWALMLSASAASSAALDLMRFIDDSPGGRVGTATLGIEHYERITTATPVAVWPSTREPVGAAAESRLKSPRSHAIAPLGLHASGVRALSGSP